MALSQFSPFFGKIAAAAIDPKYQIVIGDMLLGSDITQFIKHVEYESADGVADMAKISIENVDGIFTDTKLFQIGNEMSISFGYGLLKHVGRVELARPKYSFPQSSMPTIDLIGYTADIRMMDGKSTVSKSPKKKKKRGRTKTPKPIKHQWENPTVVEVITDIVTQGDYGFELDIDDTSPGEIGSLIIQRPNMSDYSIVKGLSNLTGYVFWVDGDIEGTWTLHFRRPSARGIVKGVQEKQYTFRYGHTLLGFDPHMALRDIKTKVVIEGRFPDTGKPYRVEVEDDAEKDVPDFIADEDVKAEIEGPIPSGPAAKIFLGEYQIDVIPKHFKTEAQIKSWLKTWFRINREGFISASGSTIGVEDLFARQTHNIEGLGKAFDGEYYFAKARHILNAESGYMTNVEVRKVL